MEADIGATPLAQATEIRGATSVMVIERGIQAPVWCLAVERSRAVGARTTEVLTVSVVPTDVQAVVAHVVAAVAAADRIAAAGGEAAAWTELVLVDDERMYLVRELTAATADGLVACLTLDRRDTSLATARREFERLVAAQLEGPAPGEPADRGPGGATTADAVAVPPGPAGLPRRRRHDPPVAPDFNAAAADEKALSRIAARLRLPT